MSGPSIILDPQKMFKSLAFLEEDTKQFVTRIHNFGQKLQQVAHLTYAIGFGELIKQAEAEVNQVGNAVVAANNTVNRACKDVVNELVGKFAAQGVKSDYTAPPFEHIHLKVNPADHAAIYPESMRKIIDDLVSDAIPAMQGAFSRLLEDVLRTKEFWVGTSADRMRQTFQKKVEPEFVVLDKTALNIAEHCYKWIIEALNFEDSLKTP
jgi:hypothetical protein